METHRVYRIGPLQEAEPERQKATPRGEEARRRTIAIPELRLTAKMLRMTRSRYLHGLATVPDHRLTWSPSADAHTPLELARAAVDFLRFTAHFATYRTLPSRETIPPIPITRDEAVAALEAGFDALSAALETVTEADLEIEVQAPWSGGGTITLGFFLASTMYVDGYMQGQLNYLQTAYGDKNPNIPEGWGNE